MIKKTRLWRVDSIHENGYNAPYFFIETTIERKSKAEAEALATAKNRSRLADFTQWTLTVTNVQKKKLNGKWYSQDEYYYKIKKKEL